MTCGKMLEKPRCGEDIRLERFAFNGKSGQTVESREMCLGGNVLVAVSGLTA